MIQYLEDQARAAELASPRCCFDAIVMLGGGLAPAMPPKREFPHLVEGTDRIWLGARLHHAKVAPPIVFRALRDTRPVWENWIFSGASRELSTIALREVVAITLDVRARTLGE